MIDAPTRLRNFSTPCACGNFLFAAAHASVKLSGNVGTAAITRALDGVSFSWFAGTPGLGGLASRLALSVFLDENRLKIFGTGMSGCWKGDVRSL